jgi:hypothetical protein
MILSIIFLFTTIIVVLSLILSAQKVKSYNFGLFSWIIALSFLLIGILLTVYSTDEISTALSRRSWPAIMAVVVETSIVGERAHSPELSCKYEVEGKEYSLTTDLKTPGFGRKRSRQQTARIILEDYQVGSEVRIHYNPEHPKEAYIRTGPYWSDYMQLSLGVLAFAIGLYGIFGVSLKKFCTE